MTTATIGYGSLFKIFDTDASPEDYATVAEVTNLNIPNLTRDAIDATHTESTSGFREFIAGLKDAGEVKVEMNFDYNSDTDKLIRAAWSSNSLQQCKIMFVDSTSPVEALTFSGIFTAYEATMPVADKMTATLTVKISGAVTYLG